MHVVLALALALHPAHFRGGGPWHVGASGVHRCVGAPAHCVETGSWAGTVRWRDCWNCIPPHHTAAALPRDGVVIYLMRGRERRRIRSSLRWPPRIRARAIVSPLEGLPSRIGAYERAGRVHGADAYLWVFFGRTHPTRRQIALAQAELRTARF